LATAPQAHRTLPRIDAFLPTVVAAVIDFITSVLLFAHFSIYRSRALLTLASGYLFTSLIVIPNALTFPARSRRPAFSGPVRQARLGFIFSGTRASPPRY